MLSGWRDKSKQIRNGQYKDYLYGQPARGLLDLKTDMILIAEFFKLRRMWKCFANSLSFLFWIRGFCISAQNTVNLAPSHIRCRIKSLLSLSVQKRKQDFWFFSKELGQKQTLNVAHLKKLGGRVQNILFSCPGISISKTQRVTSDIRAMRPFRHLIRVMFRQKYIRQGIC